MSQDFVLWVDIMLNRGSNGLEQVWKCSLRKQSWWVMRNNKGNITNGKRVLSKGDLENHDGLSSS